ncbi:hypothetical protein KCU65_g427, partial [Aureobasidium melanogenum]
MPYIQPSFPLPHRSQISSQKLRPLLLIGVSSLLEDLDEDEFFGARDGETGRGVSGFAGGGRGWWWEEEGRGGLT